MYPRASRAPGGHVYPRSVVLPLLTRNPRSRSVVFASLTSVVARWDSLVCSSLCPLAVCVIDRSAALECQLARPTYAQ